MKPAPPAPPRSSEDAPLPRWSRWYFAWAEPRYRALPQPLQAEVRRLDRQMVSRHAGWAWAGVGLSALALTAGLAVFTGGWGRSALSVLVAYALLGTAALNAWLQPEQLVRRLTSRLMLLVGLGYLGALCGFVAARLAEQPQAFLQAWPQAGALWPLVRPPLKRALEVMTPIAVAALVATLLLMTLVAWLRRRALERELAALRLTQERDAAARQAAEARLALLRSQIQPHFIFNTLSAVQHWVDSGDPRAPELLRALTGFLRGSTELLARSEVPLRDELALARHYVAVMQARMGERLHCEFEVSEAAQRQLLPPGLLLTLLENAVEHGLAPQLHGGRVQVAARRDAQGFTLSVRDQGTGLAPGWTEGVGLANCRERLQWRFGPAATLTLRARQDESGAEACVFIPEPALTTEAAA
jgi:hypothetical protein